MQGGRPSLYRCLSLEKNHNKGHTHTTPPGGRPRAPTGPRLTTKANRNISNASEDNPILCRFPHQVVFHPDTPEITPPINNDGTGWTAFPYSSGNAYLAHAITKTAASDTITPESIRSCKINSNCARPTYGQFATPRLPANPDGDVTLEASSGEINGNSEYVELP